MILACEQYRSTDCPTDAVASCVGIHTLSDGDATAELHMHDDMVSVAQSGNSRE